MRLSYILQADSRAQRYIPNIENLTDLLPNNICIVDHVFDPDRNQFSELYEVSSKRLTQNCPFSKVFFLSIFHFSHRKAT